MIFSVHHLPEGTAEKTSFLEKNRTKEPSEFMPVKAGSPFL